MITENKILIGAGDERVYLLANKANRHGLIAGATGTGKTYTLKVLAEGFSEMGVPVFLADIKGDVSSLALTGELSEGIAKRLAKIGVAEDEYKPTAYPVRFWDVFGDMGIPVRATISDVGPLLLSRLMNLTDAQTGVLNITFHVADDNGWQLVDLKDLRAMLNYVGEHRNEFTLKYGNISSASIGAIQRALLILEDQGANKFFGETSLNVAHWFDIDDNEHGMINILHCVELVNSPLLYATVMLWIMSELYEKLPEVGDLDKPRMVFFFDEAHMLFNDAPKPLLDKIVQVVKLIRSKGVGIYFITQSPSDIPDAVLAQLNNRVQHALRAYTPAEQKAVKVAADSFRPNPKFKTEDAISTIGTGVALVSTLDEDGVPTVVEIATVCPPQSGSHPIDDAERKAQIDADEFYKIYKDAVDNISAYEIIVEGKTPEGAAGNEATDSSKAEEAKAADKKSSEKADDKKAEEKSETSKKSSLTKVDPKKKSTPSSEIGKSVKKAAKSTARTVGRNLGKQITRGVLGTSSSTLSKAATQAAGSLMSDLFASFFK